jgi:hypothetical protein
MNHFLNYIPNSAEIELSEKEKVSPQLPKIFNIVKITILSRLQKIKIKFSNYWSENNKNSGQSGQTETKIIFAGDATKLQDDLFRLSILKTNENDDFID